MSVFVLYGIFNIAPIKTVKAASGDPCTMPDTGKPGHLFGSTNCRPDDGGFVGRFGTYDKYVADPKGQAVINSCSMWNVFTYVSVTCIVTGVNETIGFLAGFLIMIVMMLLEYALYLNSKIFALPGVQLGWNFTRDIANMGFVLGIIIIAFATILRSQSYGVKQLMVKLIVAAVAVNLSLSIAGVFMDLAGIPSQFFIDEISKSTSRLDGVTPEFSSTLAAAFNIQNIDSFNNSLASRGATEVASKAMLLASVFFSLIFSFIILVTLIALTSMFLYRFITLAILIILMPLAILTWVFPGSRGNWGNWLKTFLNWTFFAPIALFFLFLAVYTIRVQGNYVSTATEAMTQSSGSIASAVNSSVVIGTDKPVLLMANMILMVLMTMGGLFAAQKMSITGADAALKFAKGGAMGILKTGTVAPAGWVGRKAYGWGSAPSPDPIGGVPATPSYMARANASLASVRVLGPLLSKVTQGVNKSIKDYQEEAKKEQALFNDGTKAYRENSFNTATSLSDDGWVSGMLLSMAKNGEIRDLNAVQKQKLVDDFFVKLTRTNSAKEFAQFLPEFAKDLGLQIKKILPTAPADAYAEMKAENFKSDTGDEAKDEAAQETVLFSSGDGLRAISSRGKDPMAAFEIMRTLDRLRVKFETTYDETARTVDKATMAAGVATGATAAAIADGKKAQDRLEQFQRFAPQRDFLYNNPNFAGHADPADIDAWRDKRKGTRGGGTRRRTTPAAPAAPTGVAAAPEEWVT